MNFGAAKRTDQSFDQLFPNHFNMADAAAGDPAWITHFNSPLPPDHRIWTPRQKNDEREQPHCDIGAALPEQPGLSRSKCFLTLQSISLAVPRMVLARTISGVVPSASVESCRPSRRSRNGSRCPSADRSERRSTMKNELRCRL